MVQSVKGGDKTPDLVDRSPYFGEKSALLNSAYSLCLCRFRAIFVLIQAEKKVAGCNSILYSPATVPPY